MLILTYKQEFVLLRININIIKNKGCTRLVGDMLPSKYEDNSLQIKEKVQKELLRFFVLRSYRPFCRRYFGYPSQFGSTVLP